MTRYALVISSVFLLTAGCGASSKLQSAEETTDLRIKAHAKKGGGPSLAVGGQTITYKQIADSLTESGGRFVPLKELLKTIAQRTSLTDFTPQARSFVRQVVLNEVFSILLHNQAKKDFGENIDLMLDKETENQVREFVTDDFAGDYAAAEQYIKDQGSNWQHFKKARKSLILISSQIPKVRPVTYSDLLAAYDQFEAEFLTEPESITIRLIDIQPAKLNTTDPNQTKLQEARTLAERLVRRLNAGQDFAKLARQYSHGHRKANGGLWKPRDPNDLARPYHVLAGKAQHIQPGQVAGPIETETADHIFIMKLEERRRKTARSLAQVQRQLENRIMLKHRTAAADKIDADLAKQAQLAQTNEFIDICLERIYRVSNE
jgi:parvulin-like peptidyl-prolyl isomerase